MTNNYDIFISYKRKSLPTANNLYYRLTTRGYSTFFDLEEMGRDNFNTQLLNYIEKAKDVFVILEEGSLDACKRDDWEKDWFCHEIAFALEKKKNIIPIMIGGYQMPSEDFFPDKLKELSLKNAPEFHFSYFEAYLDKLIEKEYLLSKPNLQDKATSVFKFYSNVNCQVFKEGKLVCSLEGMSDEPYYLPVSRKGDYKFKVVNDLTGEFKIINERIDSVEEKSIDIIWKGRWMNILFNHAKRFFTKSKYQIAAKYDEIKNIIQKFLKRKTFTALSLLFVLMLTSFIIITSGSFSGTTIKEHDVVQDTIPPIIQVDTLKELANVLYSVKPIELGVLSDSVIYYKKDSSYYFINQIGTPLAGGKAFDKFTISNNIIITELVKIDSAETSERRYERNRINNKVEIIKQSKFGIISLNGMELIPCEYDKIEHPIDGVHTYKKGSLCGCVSDDSELLGCKFASIVYGGIKDLLLCQSDSDKCYYFYDKTGTLKLPNNTGEKYYSAKPFSDNLALVRLSSDDNGPNFYIDTDGNKKWDPIREGYYNFEGSYIRKKAKVSKKDEMGKIKYGIVDNKFQVILPCEYDAIEEFSNSAAEVRIDGKWKIVSYSQKEIVSIKAYYYSSFSNGYLEVEENDKTYTLYFNNQLLQRNLNNIYFYGYGDFAKVKKGDSYYLINSNGNLSQPYSSISYYEEGKVSKVRDKDGNYGIIDNNFNILVECKYKYIGDYNDGFFVAKLDSLYGYLDKGGDWAIKPIYNDAKDFRKNKLAIVKYDGKYGIIRPNKDIVAPYSYDKIIPHTSYSSIYIVCRNNKYGIFDVDEKREIVPCEFENEFTYISNDIFPVKKNRRWGIYTRDGRCTLNMFENGSSSKGNLK